MKDIKAIRGKYFIHNLIEEGEHEHQDFKYAISDARKIARSISAFANNDGGRLLIGVKDNGHIVGIPNEEDIYMIEHAACHYCYPPQTVEMTAYAVEGGAVVLHASIPRAQHRPVYCLEEGKRRVAYIRVADENIVAHELMVKAWELQSAPDYHPAALTDTDFSLLHYLEAEGQISPEDFMRKGYFSAATSRRCIVKLLSMGIIEMIHGHDGFVIRHAETVAEV